MSTPLLIPYEVFGHHGPHLAGGPPPFVPFLGALMFLLFLLLVAGALFLLSRRGLVGPPPWVARHHSPDNEAKRILAERFAKGDITSDDFLERASVLNWTPGSENWGPQGKKKRH